MAGDRRLAAGGWRRRLLPHLITLALLLLAAAPALIGLHLERLYQRGLAELTARGWQVSEHHWQHGWFHAEVLSVLTPPGQTDATGPRLRVVTEITQGPRWAELAAGAPALASATARITVLDAPRALPPLRVLFRLDLSGAFGARFSLPDVTYSGAAGQLQLVNVYADLLLDPDLTRLHGNGRLAALLINGADGQQVAITGLDWRLTLTFGTDGLPVGDLLFTVGRVRLAAATPAPDAQSPAATTRAALDAAGLRLGLRIARGPAAGAADAPVPGTADGARLTLTGALELDWLRLNGIDLAPARLVAALTDLDTATLVALRAGLGTIDAAGLTPSMRGRALGGLLQQHLPALLAATPRLRIDPIELRTPDGTLSGSVLFGLAPAPASGAPADPPAPAAPIRLDVPTAAAPGEAFWRQRLTGEASLALPQPLVRRWLLERQRRRAEGELAELGADPATLPPTLEAELAAATDAALASLIRERWLIPSGGRLTARILIGEGLLTINGRTVPLP